MINYKKIFSDSIDQVKKEGRYRIFTELEYINSKVPVAFSSRFNREITVWCSNDYLGMSQNKKVREAAITAVEQSGLGSGGTRNISGTNSSMVSLENELACLHHKEAALVFTSGYVANQATLPTLAKIIPDILFISDELNHASMINGIRDSRNEKRIFKHADVDDLQKTLAQYPKSRPKIIVFESVYSMEGDISPIEKYVELAAQYNALTYLDEVHSVGLYGERGAGIAQMLGVQDKIDIIQGTLAKAFGVIGGYITGNREIIDAVRSHAPGFIFTTSLPPCISAAVVESIKHLKQSEAEREKHKEVYNKVKTCFRKLGVNFINHNTHIIPIIIGDPVKVQSISEILLRDYGIYIQHINFPTVPKGSERLRITPTPLHTDEMIEYMTKSVHKVIWEHKVKMVA